jgi:VCBS repeat-containing protein
VNDPPVAVDDTFNVAESIAIPKAQSAVLDVLLNDSDVDGDVLRIIRTSSPANGSVEIATDALTLTYEPTADFTGSDQFTYTISDGNAGQDIATVTISVQPVNDPPTVADGTFATNEDEVRTVQAPGVLRNASDPEDDPLTAVLVTDVSHGVLQLSGDGGFVYDPDTDFNGQDQFTFAATDGLSQSAPATAVINVIGINDAPVATADSYATSEDETLTVSAPGILENDVDVDGDALTITVVNGVMHGELNVSQDGGFTYTPDEAYSGDDGFQYQIDDGTLASQATVTISVGPVNDPPTASPDQFDVASNVDLEVPPPGVLENDADEEGDMLSALLVDSPQGELDLGSDGGFLYSPPEGYSGTDSFSYRASDGVNLSEETTVVILVSAVGNPPVGVADEYSVPVNDTLEVSTPGVLENDSDEDGDSLSAVLVDDVSEGTLALTREGGFTYEPPIDFAGIVTFRYRASDGANVSKITLVTITVQ